MDKKFIELAVIGVGSMGAFHLENINGMEKVRLKAVFDVNQAAAGEAAEKYSVRTFPSLEELYRWGEFDAVLIATPHYFHKETAIEAFRYGFHVLTEKPVGVHVKDIQEMISAWHEAKKKYPHLIFNAMFQQRTLGHWLKIRDLIDSGELGKLVRVSWIITDWYRTQIYFSGSEWKATWKGEGGGVLLNQSPHQLDLFQWFFGVPDRITAFASMGKYHHIEVEDEVTGYFQYDNGLIGHFITSTGECPGTNRLEIVGEMGKLIFEDGRLKFFRTRSSMLDYIESSEEPFGTVETWEIDIPYEKTEESGHSTVIENFASCILNSGEPVARAEEGIHSVAMANAMILSSLKNETISLPLDGNRYEEALNELIENSDFRKETTGRSRTGSMKSSF